MIVKKNEGQLSFLFQETDPYFEVGYKILEQAKIAEMLPYKRKLQNGRDKLCFILNENCISLSEVLGSFDNNDIVDLLYELVFLTQKVQENGFLKKECIWYNFEHIFYDKKEKMLKLAILPITREFRYADDLSWYGRFENTIMNITAYLSEVKADQVNKYIKLMRNDSLSCDEVLDCINKLGSGNSGLLVGRTEELLDTELQLIYSGRDGRLEFNVAKDEYLIGKNSKIVDGAVPMSISRAVSRKHCMITRMNKKYFVQDLDSSNCTLVNGIMIPAYELMELTNSDILSVADVEFRVIIREKRYV